MFKELLWWDNKAVEPMGDVDDGDISFRRVVREMYVE